MGQWASGPETAVWTWPSRLLSKGDLRALHAGTEVPGMQLTDLRIQNVQVQIYPLKFSGGSDVLCPDDFCS